MSLDQSRTPAKLFGDIGYSKKGTLILTSLLEDLVLPLLFVQEPRNDYDHFKVMCLYSLGP